MNLRLLLTVLTLVVFLVVPPESARADDPFAGRIPKDLQKLEELKRAVKDSSVPTQSGASVCNPGSPGSNVYGFHRLDGEQGTAFDLFGRTQFYSLTPNRDGNLEIPTSWNGAKVTEQAHEYGSRVDLVISNGIFEWEDNNKREGLLLTKSYVLLTLIDDVIKAVDDHNFDGVTIDFRLPEDLATRDSFEFFINRLAQRLQNDPPKKRVNDLLEFGDRQLNLVIDRSFIESLVEISGRNSSDKQPEYKAQVDVLMELLNQISESVSSLIIEPDLLAAADGRTHPVENAIGKVYTGERAKNAPSTVMIINKDSITEDTVAVWDVGALGKNEILGKKVFEGWYLSNIFAQDGRPFLGKLCSERGWISMTLAGLTPILALYVLVSWGFYGFLSGRKQSVANLIAWALLAISFITFVLLMTALPSHDLENARLRIISFSFVIPLAYLLWPRISKTGKKRLP